LNQDCVLDIKTCTNLIQVSMMPIDALPDDLDALRALVCAFRRRRPRCPAHADHVIRSMTTRAAHERDGAVGFIF
jgi:hypothetical protein